jgi:hypothetical protein
MERRDFLPEGAPGETWLPYLREQPGESGNKVSVSEADFLFVPADNLL